jgi:glyoxylase-like metal-dependent hydrolase (beta-lactamase superfamily II)
MAAATVRAHPLLCGTARWAEAWPHREDGPLAAARALGVGSPQVTIPLPAFLIEHPTEGPMLIDTGLDASIAHGRTRNMGRLTAETSARSFRLEPEWAAPERLRARGVDPDDVKLIVMTHLHLDHASGMRQFPDATFAISRAEWEAAHGSMPMLHGYVPSHYEGVTTRLLEFGDEPIDLLGDGSVRLIFTPGHTHGHMSVLLRTAAGEVLVAGDAVYTRHALATGHRPYKMEDPKLFSRSLEAIQSYAGDHPDCLVIPGHDMDAWNDLDEVYG